MNCCVKVRSRVIDLFLTAALAAASALPAFATETHKFEVPAEEAPAAIRDFASQAQVQILAAGENVKDKKLHAVSGDLSTDQGLKILLADSGLTPQYVGDRSIALVTDRDLNAGSTTGGNDKGAHKSAGKLRLAQVDQGKTSSDVPVEKDQKPNSNAENPNAGLAEILVKGSRILNVDVTRTEDDPQPYYILDAKEIEQSGSNNINDFLKNQLTMNTTSLSSNQRYGQPFGTTSSINLRGLGSNETLILIDGRRTAGVSLSGATNQPDINGIPVSAIERIEVLPSSASAIYGGAAMGGVVNVILKKNYDGGNFDYTFENTTSGSAPIRTLNANYGFSLGGGKTQVMISGHYTDGDVLLTQSRLGLIGGNYASIYRNSPGFFISDPSTPVVGSTPNIGSADGVTNLTLKGGGAPFNSPMATIAAGASAATPATIIPGQWSNSVAQQAEESGPSISTAPRVKSLMASIRQELTSNVSVFTEFSTISNIGHSVFRAIDTTGGLFVPASSPANPFNQDVNVSFPNTPLTPYLTDSVTQSLTAGVLASLPGEWKSEFDYTWSRNSFEYSSFTTDFGSGLANALADGTVNPFVDTIAHPLNLTPYLGNETFSGVSTLSDFALRLSGPIVSLPWGKPTVTIGLEHRKEALGDSNFDFIYPASPDDGSRRRYFGQSQSTDSIYAEALFPLVTQKNAMPLLRALDLQLAGRSERYTVNVGTPYALLAPDGSVESGSPPQGLRKKIEYTSTNPTIGLKYKPVQDVIFRASYAKAFLPPTSAQLLPNPTPTTYTNTITDPQTGETYPVHLITGGNPNLQPQTAQDWDLGLIFEPQEEFLKGLRVDLEYYRITQPNYITVPGTQTVVSDPTLSSRVTRDPITGRITLVDDSSVNATEFKTSGYDLTLDYRKSTTFGTFYLHGVGTMTQHDLRQYTIGGQLLDYVGYPGENAEAKFKANATLSWQYRQWSAGWTTTFFGSYRQVGAPGDPGNVRFGLFTRDTDAQGGYTIPSQTYHTVFASYSSGKTGANLLSGLTVQAGIKNVFNSSPPFDANYSPYYLSPYGDARLRDYWISLSKAF